MSVVVLLRFLFAIAMTPVVIFITNAAFRSVCKDVNFEGIFEQVRNIKLKFKVVVVVVSLVATAHLLSQALTEGKLHLEVLLGHGASARDEGRRDRR